MIEEFNTESRGFIDMMEKIFNCRDLFHSQECSNLLLKISSKRSAYNSHECDLKRLRTGHLSAGIKDQFNRKSNQTKIAICLSSFTNICSETDTCLKEIVISGSVLPSN